MLLCVAVYTGLAVLGGFAVLVFLCVAYKLGLFNCCNICSAGSANGKTKSNKHMMEGHPGKKKRYSTIAGGGGCRWLGRIIKVGMLKLGAFVDAKAGCLSIS